MQTEPHLESMSFLKKREKLKVASAGTETKRSGEDDWVKARQLVGGQEETQLGSHQQTGLEKPQSWA